MKETNTVIYVVEEDALTSVIKGILLGIIALAFIAVAGLVIAWLIDLNSMSQVESIAFDLDCAVNGDAVALFRSFKDYALETLEAFKELI